MAGTSDRHQVLAEAVQKRMDQLGHTLESLGEHITKIDAVGSGLSTRTLSHMRAGTGASYHRRTRRLVERALEWAPGSIDDILEGTADEPELADSVDELTLSQLTEEMQELRKRLDRITEALGRAVGPGAGAS